MEAKITNRFVDKGLIEYTINVKIKDTEICEITKRSKLLQKKMIDLAIKKAKKKVIRDWV